MKKSFLLISVCFLVFACVQTTKSVENKDPQIQSPANTGSSIANQDSKPVTPDKLLTLPDAEKILGQPAHLADSSSGRDHNIFTYQCAYKANAEDTISGKTGALYFLAEHYSNVSDARKKYSFIKTANENHGIKVLHDLGDEAYFHSDGRNFYFIMVRKGMRVFNMKVNKITSATSLDEFNIIAKHITDAL
ncbi:MAG TPA: hypothetical protein VJY62_00245 [Bacteroidia bacterium]|nr:hypothetical protein [Bacteroidia bacterium]